MIKSMTGFASLTRDEASVTISVTIRAVNHRFLDVQLRSPSSLAAIEPRLRALVQQHVARGRVEVGISVQSRLGQPLVDITVNDAVIEGLSSALERARERGLVVGGLTAGDLLRFPQAISITDRKDDAPDAGVPPAVFLKQKDGTELNFGLKDGGKYAFVVKDGKIVNAIKP